MNETPSDPADIESCVDAAVERWGSEATQLLQVLREVQERYNYVPPAAMDRAAYRLGLSVARVRGVVHFYEFLATEPTGDYRILFSDNVTDRICGSTELLSRMCQRLWAEPGKPAQDGLVCVDRTSFLGFCDQAPSLLVNQRPITRLDAARIDTVCELILARKPLDAWPADLFEIEEQVRRKGPLLSIDAATR